MRYLLVAVLLLVGCSRTAKHEHTVTVKVDELWRAGLTDKQAAKVQADKGIGDREYDRIMSELGKRSGDDAEARAAYLRVRECYMRYSDGALSGRLAEVAAQYRKDFEGKTLADLAAEHRASQH